MKIYLVEGNPIHFIIGFLQGLFFGFCLFVSIYHVKRNSKGIKQAIKKVKMKKNKIKVIQKKVPLTFEEETLEEMDKKIGVGKKKYQLKKKG